MIRRCFAWYRVARSSSTECWFLNQGAGLRTKGLLMAFKLLDIAQQRWSPFPMRHETDASTSATTRGKRKESANRGYPRRSLMCRTITPKCGQIAQPSPAVDTDKPETLRGRGQ